MILVVEKGIFDERFKKSCLKSIESGINTETEMILGLKGSVLGVCQDGHVENLRCNVNFLGCTTGCPGD